MHQLIVLGNGFDLECGLDSSFGDFFKERKKNLRPSGKEIGNELWDSYITSKGLTAWDIILGENDDDRYWHDIEEAIREWVIGDDGDKGNEHFSVIKQIMDLPDRSDIPGPADGPTQDTGWEWMAKTSLLCPWTMPDPWEEPESTWEPDDSTNMKVAKYLYQLTDWHELDSMKRPPVWKLLFDELNKLEKAFSQYLVDNLMEHRQLYKKRACECLTWLITAEVRGDNEKQRAFPNTSILDFNYTNPFSNLTTKVGASVNIHGCLNEQKPEQSNIIFGIDGKDHMKDTEIVPFTKTYRLLALNDQDRGKLVHTDVNGIDGVTDLIKFYGHSLNPADYSYFQAIFDGVDLYQSHTRLIFYYKSAIDGAQEKMFRKVTRLMRDYGTTLDNKDHGQNLMHKLLLEGRLSIKPFTCHDEED